MGILGFIYFFERAYANVHTCTSWGMGGEGGREFQADSPLSEEHDGAPSHNPEIMT